MPITPRSHVDQPFVRDAFVPSIGTLQDILARQGQLQAQSALQRGQAGASTWAGLAQAFQGAQEAYRAQEMQAAALAQREQERQAATALKLLEMDERAKERAEQNRIRLEAEGRQKRAEAMARAGVTQPGVISSEMAEDLRPSGRVQVLDGAPVLMRTPEQMRQADLDKAAAAREAALVADRDADNQRQANAFLETQRHNKSMEATARVNSQKPPDERLVQVMDDSGRPIWVRESQAVGKPATQAARAVTGQERKVLGFFQRMLDAERNARAVEDAVGGRDFAAEWLPGDWLENFAKTPEGQKYTQAQRTFTEGRLRKESGAAVPQNEYDSDRDTNFKRANDTPDNVTQKRNSRLRLLRGAANEAGKALEEYYGPGTTIDSLLSEFGAGDSGALKVRLIAPDGSIKDVDPSEVDHYVSRGAKVKK